MAEVMAASAVQNATAINVHVYRNGDPYFPAKKCVVNPRKVNFDSFLNEVTRLVRLSGGAVRNIYTPTQGHRVREVHDLVNNSYYVAAGAERFKRDQYAVAGVRMIRQRPRPSRQIRPVAHSRIQVSAKCRKTQEGPKIIHVYRNRDDKSPPIKLLLDKRHRANMDSVYDYVNLKVNLMSGQAVQRLYHLNGAQVLDESEIESGGQYVAAAREKFARVGYGNTEMLSPRGKARTFIFGRVPSNRTYGLKPVVTLPKVRTAVKTSPRPPPQSTRRTATKPTPKPPARKPLVQRRKPPEKSTPKKEAEGVFHMKPTMVKRSREKEDKGSLDYSDDPNSVFKAKDKREETEGANEVQDTKDTVTELPIDQVAAEEVEEEDSLKEDVAPKDDAKVVKEEPSKAKTPEVAEEVAEEVEPEEQEIPEANQNNNHLKNSRQDSPLETNDPPPVIDEDIKPSSSSPVTPEPMSPIPSPPQDRPKSSQSPALMTDKSKSPSPKQEAIMIASPDLELPKSPSLKSPSPPSSNTPSPKSASPKPLSPQQGKSASPEVLPKSPSPEQPKSPSPTALAATAVAAAAVAAATAESPSPQKSDSPSPTRISPAAKPPSERGSASSSQRSVSAPAGNLQDKNEEPNNSNSNDDQDDNETSEVPEDIPVEEEEHTQSPQENQTLNQDKNDNQDIYDSNKPTDNQSPSPQEKAPSPDDKTRTPTPPKSPRKMPARSRSITPPTQSAAPKEQIGNGHIHIAEEVNV